MEPASVYSLLQAIKSVEELSVTLSRDVLELGFLSRYPQLKVLNLFQKYVFTFSVLAVLPEGLRVNLECWDQVWFDEGDLAYMRRGQRLCLKGQQIRNLHEIVRTCSIEMLPEGASLELWRFNAEGGEDLVFSLYRENMEGGSPNRGWSSCSSFILIYIYIYISDSYIVIIESILNIGYPPYHPPSAHQSRLRDNVPPINPLRDNVTI